MALVTHAALKAAPRGGLVPEDVMAKIWDISKIPLPAQDLFGEDTHTNEYTEWTKDKLGAVNYANKVVDGSDAPADNNALGTRAGNHSQISVKVVSASTRARDGKTINLGEAYAYQVMMRQQELRRDIDGMCIGNTASVADDGAAVAGQAAGLDAWIVTNANNGATGANGGFQTGSGLVTAATPGTARALSETTIRDTAQAIWTAGGNPTVLMGRPPVIRKLSSYMFSGSAQVATLMSDVKEKRGAAVATGSVNVFVTDFGVVMEMLANRLQGTTAANTSTVFLLDPEYAHISYLSRPQTFELAKTGLAQKGEMFADWTLKVMNEEAFGAIRAINETLAVVA